MLKAIYAARDFLGIDKTITVILANRGWGLVSGLVNISLITTYFSPAIQGYHYTFASLLAFQVLLELGFGTVLVQFVSHEWAFLGFGHDGSIQGNADALSRLASLVRLAIKWYIVLAIMFFIVTGIAGTLFLAQRDETGVRFEAPWILLCGMVSISILSNPVRSFLEGSNQVARSQSVGLKAAVASSLAGWVAIILGAQLYTLPIISGVSALLSLLLFLRTSVPFLRLTRIVEIRERIAWRKDFWPQQWRIGVSWLSGFIMFQSFVPIFFKLGGPIAAGRLGATMQIYTLANSIGYAWVMAVAPQMGILGARKEISRLVMVVKKTFLRSATVCSLTSVCAVFAIALLHILNMKQADRFADIFSIAMLLVTAIALQLPNIETLAIRFQKREPFVINSIVSAVLVLVSNVLLGRYYGIQGSIVGFSAIMLFITIPWVHSIYKTEVQKLSR